MKQWATHLRAGISFGLPCTAIAAFIACGGAALDSMDGGDASDGAAPTSDATTWTDTGTISPSDASSSADAHQGQEPDGCTGFACAQATCTGAASTTITGRVLDPGGKNPLANVIVYVK